MNFIYAQSKSHKITNSQQNSPSTTTIKTFSFSFVSLWFPLVSIWIWLLRWRKGKVPKFQKTIFYFPFWLMIRINQILFVCLFFLFPKKEKSFVFCSKCENPKLYLIDYFFYFKTTRNETAWTTCYDNVCLTHVDSHTRRLECCAFQWHGKDKPLGCVVFRCIDDIRQLRAVQFTGCYFGGRL